MSAGRTNKRLNPEHAVAKQKFAVSWTSAFTTRVMEAMYDEYF